MPKHYIESISIIVSVSSTVIYTHIICTGSVSLFELAS